MASFGRVRMKLICSQSHDCQSCSIIALRFDLEPVGKENMDRIDVAAANDGDLDSMDGDLDDMDGDLDEALKFIIVDVDDDEELLCC